MQSINMVKSATRLISPAHRQAVRARLGATATPRSGPGSVAWKINREVIAIAGWGRAILLQLAHPAIAAGIEHHSSFRGSLLSGLRRLHATVSAMLAIVFGDIDEMVDAAARINTIHDRVRGHFAAPADGRSDGGPGNGEAGKPYSAHDPELQRWVHATLLDSIPRTYERFVAPLTAEERDRYCAETAIMESLLAMPGETLPRNVAQLDSYMGAMLASGTLIVTARSRALAQALLYPPRWRVIWPVLRPMQLLTIGTLPPSIREAYGFAWRPRDARALARWTAFLRIALRLLPPVVRQWPVARRGMARIGRAAVPASTPTNATGTL
jgi:uncharacterized protein (DUF2236 family)